ncbi:TPA: hypothetical protein ACHJX8_003675 [Yersinia enterocolitica]
MDKKELEIALVYAESQEAILRDELRIAEINYTDEIQRYSVSTDGSIAQEVRRDASLEKFRNIERAAQTALVNQTQVVSDLRTQLHSYH